VERKCPWFFWMIYLVIVQLILPTDLSQVIHKLYHITFSRVDPAWAGFELTTLVGTIELSSNYRNILQNIVIKHLTNPIMRTSISISCERARKLCFHQIHCDLLKKCLFCLRLIPIATSLLYSFVIHCIVYLNNYSIFVKLYDIYHIVIHTFEWELHIEKYRIECGRSRICILLIQTRFPQWSKGRLSVSIPIMRTSISISCERARKLCFHQICN
jgi:hypothetical protein